MLQIRTATSAVRRLTCDYVSVKGAEYYDIYNHHNLFQVTMAVYKCFRLLNQVQQSILSYLYVTVMSIK